jgi:hypothetical protein
LNNVNPSLLVFDNDIDNNYEKKFLNVIKLFLNNEINLGFIQSILHKYNITMSQILGHLQFKLNKIKLKDPEYSKIGTCNICFGDDVKLQLYDCLGHYYCLECTINMEKCAVCRCIKKCDHI